MDIVLKIYRKLRRKVKKMLVGALTLTAYAMGISELIDGWLALISTAMIAVIVYLFCTYLFLIRPDERRNLKNYIGKRIGQLIVG